MSNKTEKEIENSSLEIHTICVTFEPSKEKIKIKTKSFLLTNDFPFYFKDFFFHIQHCIYMV